MVQHLKNLEEGNIMLRIKETLFYKLEPVAQKGLYGDDLAVVPVQERVLRDEGCALKRIPYNPMLTMGAQKICFHVSWANGAKAPMNSLANRLYRISSKRRTE